MNKRYAIFDLDGTLVDSMPVWTHLGREYLRIKNLPSPTPEQIARIYSMTVSESAACFVQWFSLKESPETIAYEINTMMARHYQKDIPLKPGVRPLLEQLHAQGVRMCVASATAEPLMYSGLKRLGVLSYFDFLLSCEAIGANKFRPDVYFAAAEKFRAAPSEIAVFEDALYAIRTAKHAGFYVVGVRDPAGEADWPLIQELSDELTDFE